MDPVLNSKNCRWHNHLNPEIRKDAWTPEEERALINAHKVFGNKWAEIAKALPGRYLLHCLLHWFSLYKITYVSKPREKGGLLLDVVLDFFLGLSDDSLKCGNIIMSHQFFNAKIRQW